MKMCIRLFSTSFALAYAFEMMKHVAIQYRFMQYGILSNNLSTLEQMEFWISINYVSVEVVAVTSDFKPSGLLLPFD